jgi:dolichyl-phosphate beta-glucosyltransferase
MTHLSVIIPAYNEEKRLLSTLGSVHDFLSAEESLFEIIIVDDGSSDGTCDVVKNFAVDHCGIRLISHSPNRGKGYSVRKGIEAGQGDLLLINDADGSSPIEEIKRLEKALEDGADIAIGSRAIPDQDTKVKAYPYRKIMGNTFNTIVQTLLLPGIRDTQCGFKLFKKEQGKELFAKAKLDRYAFDVEILYLARLYNYRIAEIPINWQNVRGSKINIVLDPLRMLTEIFQILLTKWAGGYGAPSPASLKPASKKDEVDA